MTVTVVAAGDYPNLKMHLNLTFNICFAQISQVAAKTGGVSTYV